MPDKAYDVFISYSRRDLDFVKQLHQKLTETGVSAWFDQEDIHLGDQWRSSIVEGIGDCKVFVLVLSPDSTASPNVRKEVDLAERYKKKIAPLMWRQTDIPVAMEYQLAGIQYVDFQEEASEENFNKFTNALQRLVGGATLAEVADEIGQEPVVPAKEKPAPPPSSRGRGRGRGRRRVEEKRGVSPVAVGGAVISGVVTRLGLTADQDWVFDELKWLFYAADNFLKIRGGDIDRDHQVPQPIPLDENGDPISDANNQLLSALDDFDLKIWEGKIEAGFNRIGIHLKSLDILLEQEAKGRNDLGLKHQLNDTRVEIVNILQEMAELMNQAYNVLITAPDELKDILANQ